MQLYTGIYLDKIGQPKASATIKVVNTGTTTLVTVHDINGAVIVNPFSTDSEGRFSFRVPNGVYDFLDAQDQVIQSEVQIFDLNELNLQSIPITGAIVDESIAGSGFVEFDNKLLVQWRTSGSQTAPTGPGLIDTSISWPKAFKATPWTYSIAVQRAGKSAASAGSDKLIAIWAQTVTSTTLVATSEWGSNSDGETFSVKVIAIGEAA